MAKRRNRLNSDITTAKQRATVRFAPERSTIKALIGDAQSRFGTDLTAADAGAKSAIHFADRARKPTVSIFDAARSQADAARSDVETAFGKLGGAADPFRAATSREQAGSTQRLALARAQALNDLTSRQYAGNQARSTFRKDVGDLGARLRDLGDRQGAFVAQEAASLADARHKQGVPIRVARINAQARSRSDRSKFAQAKELEGIKQAGREKLAKTRAASGGGTGLGGNKPATRSERRGFESDFAKALSYARDYVGAQPRHVAANTLISGAPATKSAEGVPAIGNQLALSVALDMAYDGHVSRANARRMKSQAGIRLADIPGLTSYSNWLHKRTPRVSSGGGGGPRGTGR
jgi:hypothetical protein